MTSDLCANTDLITTGKLNDELFCFNLINRLYVISCYVFYLCFSFDVMLKVLFVMVKIRSSTC